MLASGLPPVARSLMLVLLTRTDAGTARIPAQWNPSLTELAALSGRHRSTVARHLAGLEQDGWLIRRRPPPDTRKFGATTRYEMTVPGQNGSEVVAQEDGGSRTARQGVVAQEDGGSRTAQRKSDRHRPESDPELIRLARDELAARTGRHVSERWAARIVSLLTARRELRSPAAYIRQAIRAEPDPGRFLPASQPPRFRDGKFTEKEDTP